METIKSYLKIIVDAINDKKGEDIKILDISNISPIADYFVIANGNNPNQVEAIVDNIDEQLSKAGLTECRKEGGYAASWVLMDYEDIIVHIFSKEDRAFYDLERIWKDGIEVNIE